MIVIAIIAVLCVVLIPKALPMRDQAKNNGVQANVYIVRSFLENRAGADKTSITKDITTKSLSAALDKVQKDIKVEMDKDFTVNKDMKNPFNNRTTINSTTQTTLNNDPANSSVVIGYETTDIPVNISSINKIVATPGVIAIIVYKRVM